TLKYTHDYPDRFASYDDAHAFCVRFVEGYNHHHRHSGIAFLAPADVHYGRTEAILSVRTAALHAAYKAHPERFVRGRPTPHRPPAAVYINPPRRPERGLREYDVHVLTNRCITTDPSSEHLSGEISHSLNLTSTVSQSH
ncbi:hypothetical protein ACOXH8_36465, partial [Nannocystis pusilla]